MVHHDAPWPAAEQERKRLVSGLVRLSSQGWLNSSTHAAAPGTHGGDGQCSWHALREDTPTRCGESQVWIVRVVAQEHLHSTHVLHCHDVKLTLYRCQVVTKRQLLQARQRRGDSCD
jgi:hypothetical protein